MTAGRAVAGGVGIGMALSVIFALLILVGDGPASDQVSENQVSGMVTDEIKRDMRAACERDESGFCLFPQPGLVDPLDTLRAASQGHVLPRTVDEVGDRLAETDLDPERIAEARSLARPAVALVPRDSRSDGSFGGRTYVGGYPWLPAEYPWPSDDGAPLSLVAQIDLDALDDEALTAVPAHGLLQFYLPLRGDGVFNGGGGGATVLWFEDTSDFVHRTDGTAAWGEFTLNLDYRPFLSLPSADTDPLRKWNAHDRDAYAAYPGEMATNEQLGGWSGGFQYDPSAAARTSSDTELGEIEGWTSLLELSVSPGVDTFGMWGDAGQIRWYVRVGDLTTNDVTGVQWDFVT